MKPTVFVGSSEAAFATAELVKAKLSSVAEVYHWKDDGLFDLSRGAFECLLDALDRFDFAVLLFTPDDPVIHAGQPKFKPRDNVLIEFGLFTGGLGRDRTFAMIPRHEQALHIPTDLAGVTIADLTSSNAPDQRYNVDAGCKKIASAIKSRGFRPRLIRELGVLYRIVNALTFPFYEDVHVPALKRAHVTYRPHETFERVDDVIGFLGELLADYVYPQLNPTQIETLRIYFGYYLGDGIADPPGGVDTRVCWDQDSDGNIFAGQFVIGLANPTEVMSERDWRIGRAITGFSKMLPQSMCANAFESGTLVGYDDERKMSPGMPNYKTPGELSVYSFPVEWRSQDGTGRVGVITVSSRKAHAVGDELRAIINLLANIVGFLFSLYAVRHRSELEREGVIAADDSAPTRGFSGNPNVKNGKRFVAAVRGLRRVVAGYFEKNMFAQRRHQLADGRIVVSEHSPEP